MHPIIEEHKTAIILIGYQNDYFSPDGSLYQVIEDPLTVTAVIENTIQLLSNCVASSLLVITTPIFFTTNYEELIEPVGILKKIKELNAFQIGDPGSESIKELRPFQDRILEVPGKRGFNAFINTNLDQILREKGIENIVLAGAITSICIDSTGRSAHEKGYRVIMLSDCTLARTKFEQEFYCNNVFSLYAEEMTYRELLRCLSNNQFLAEEHILESV